MKINQLRILNLILTIVFILLNIYVGNKPNWEFYQDISIIILMAGIIDVYLHELDD